MNIFMSYRRQDSEWVSLSLFNALKQQFPNDGIFKDFNSIKAGDDFTKALESNLASCDVLLVVIGMEWLSAKDESGVQRIFNPGDYVCLEIATAIEKGKKVIPVLINNTRMPAADALPDRIKELHKLQAVRVNSSNFEMDVFSLANAIRESIGKRNQYADLVKDIASGKVNQQELVKPETNTAYAIVCICLGLLILFLNSDSTPFVLICAVMITAGAYAYFLSLKVKPLWLDKNFEKARQHARNTKLISLIAPISGVVLLFIVILLQGFQFLAGGDMNEVNDLVKKMQPDSISQIERKTEELSQRDAKIQVQPASKAPEIEKTVADLSNETIYIVTQNTTIFNSPNIEDLTLNFLYEGSIVELIEIQNPFAKVKFTHTDGEKYTCWIAAADLITAE